MTNRYEERTYYDIVDCEFITEVVPVPTRPIVGLPRIIKHAEVMGVDKHEAVKARLRYLKDNPNEEEAKQLLRWLNSGDKSSGFSDFEDLKDTAHTTDVRVVLDYADIKYKPSGLLKCPFHNDENDSASVAKGVLVCFAGCKPKNSNRNFFDAVAVYRELFNVGYKEAVQEIGQL